MDEDAPQLDVRFKPSNGGRRHVRLSNVERAVLVTAWLATSLLGAAFVYWTRMASGQHEMAPIAATAFVVIMSGIYFVGARLYLVQKAIKESEPSPALDRYVDALKLALIQQLIFLILTALMLDGGESFC